MRLGKTSTSKGLCRPYNHPMAIYLGMFSAFEYWLPARLTWQPYLGKLPLATAGMEASGIRPARLRVLKGPAPGNGELKRALHGVLRDLSEPVDVLVPRPQDRRASPRVRPHVWTGPVPSGAFISIAPSLYVSTPEFALLQMARFLSPVGLVQLLYEACGAYSLPFRSVAGSDRCLPLTSVARLSRFLDRVPRTPGVAQARRAVRQVSDRSASVAETRMAMLFCLPRTMGGYGLPLPEMNHPIAVPPHLRGLLQRDLLVLDAYWPRANYAVEYNGKLHFDEDRANRDRKRGNALTALGIPVATIAYEELGSAYAFDLEARKLAKALGVRLRPEMLGAKWRMRRGTLRRELLCSELPAWRS